ncbi:acyltransferase [Bacteroides xylanisolvens]|uniref:acyltransferase n=1 Tax=Bacteroides xylanisolvens TaxID=371601 RepID=UPI002307279E|nr:acyltransferase [Bacteroides xylanisolvens]MDB0716236.1 acyltransferase [Bacteroides xylanisolvens]MDB0739457.1 acyltransferase [Bacteroides xylanisolvens]
MIYLLLFQLLVVLLTCNTTFVILTSLFTFLLYKVKRQYKLGGGDSQNDVIKKKYSFLYWLKRYMGGFMRYYDYRVSRVPSHHLRYFIYRHVYCVDMAPKVVVYYGAEMREPYKIRIGGGSIIGDKAVLDGRNGIEIGENVNLSSNVSIWTEQHDHRDSFFRCDTQKKTPVKIGNRVWIGPNTLILHSVEIGEGAVVAAGAVVTKSVEPYSIVAGIPAKKIGERNRDLKYEMTGEYVPFY